MDYFDSYILSKSYSQAVFVETSPNDCCRRSLPSSWYLFSPVSRIHSCSFSMRNAFGLILVQRIHHFLESLERSLMMILGVSLEAIGKQENRAFIVY